MRLLLDTHILIWACDSPRKLTSKTRAAITAPANDVFVSVASVWEMSIKAALGRLQFAMNRMPEVLTDMGFEPLSIAIGHGVEAGALPRHHEDPFDRMLIAQARLDGLKLITVDDQFRLYDVPLFQG